MSSGLKSVKGFKKSVLDLLTFDQDVSFGLFLFNSTRENEA